MSAPLLHTWTIEPIEDPIFGPPKPVSCSEGWKSHTWKVIIEEGMVGFECKECRLCDDGLGELEREYIYTEFSAKVEFHVERYADDVDAWLDIIPIGEDND